EGPDPVSAEVREAVDRASVAACDQRLRERVVRPRERDPGAAPRCYLEASHAHVEVAPLEGRDERLPVVLHELRTEPEPPRESVGQLDLEADEPAAARILEHVRLAPLHVAAPAEGAAGAQAGKRVVGRDATARGDERDQRAPAGPHLAACLANGRPRSNNLATVGRRGTLLLRERPCAPSPPRCFSSSRSRHRRPPATRPGPSRPTRTFSRSSP